MLFRAVFAEGQAEPFLAKSNYYERISIKNIPERESSLTLCYLFLFLKL